MCAVTPASCSSVNSVHRHPCAATRMLRVRMKLFRVIVLRSARRSNCSTAAVGGSAVGQNDRAGPGALRTTPLHYLFGSTSCNVTAWRASDVKGSRYPATMAALTDDHARTSCSELPRAILPICRHQVSAELVNWARGAAQRRC